MAYVNTFTFICVMVFSPVLAVAAKIHIVVHVPTSTPANVSVYVAGSLPSVGTWRPDGLKLSREAGDTYAGDLEIKSPQTLEYKITKGTWATVEKNTDGTDRPNRSLSIEGIPRQVDITVVAWGSEANSKRLPSTVIGQLKLHTIDSKYLNTTRTIRVWLPPGYETDARTKYPVLYMQDGQNCFDRATSAFGQEWEIDETLTKLIAEKQITPLIVVGVDNGLAKRTDEYTFDADSDHGGGKGEVYAKFLIQEVKPFVDKTYRTLADQPHTFTGGSSLGGIISLQTAWHHPGTFGGVITMSPALQWANEAVSREIEHEPKGLAGADVWIDMGTKEAYTSVAEDAAAQIKNR